MAALGEEPAGLAQAEQDAHQHEQQLEQHHGMHEGAMHEGGIHEGGMHEGGMHEGGMHEGVLHEGTPVHQGHPGHEDVEIEGEEYDDDPMSVRDPSNTKQLTLSYQGEVYVFDTVPPEKVQAVLLLLGSQETPAGLSLAQLGKGYDLPSRLNQPMRLASLQRFREKRKERNYDKKIRYSVRKEVAQRMQRKKGQFASNRPQPSDDGSGGGEFGSDGQAHQEMTCTNCGIGEKQTPMMRRGPHGPGTLCNACGLQWASKGALRDTRKDKQPRDSMDGQENVHQEYLPQLLPEPISSEHQSMVQGQEVLGQQIQAIDVPGNQLAIEGVLPNATEMAPPIANGTAQ
ncbi:GATA transcription factor [Klebsormidium nitens]|uniref:GATA transcription factor n=1 Tax=Klebsormidium nitens TaxID=105231 RepID=A0A1Y1HSQ0_KLENI|nr:GATA transcription factor [Klebsormidium nitens]|eukprot:GAQ80842.1 GATA transcription factor [Klebsormidium nitens]